MKIAVVSDTHGAVWRLESLKNIIDECDFLFFLGDGEIDIKRLGGLFKAQIVAVAGNSDFRGFYEKEVVEEVCGVKFLLTHCHAYGVNAGMDRLLSRAKEKECRVALYGHTHRAIVEERDGITVMNPGSLGYPDDGRPSYGIIECDKNGIFAKIAYI